jgi:SPP1 gp7 family putative phage head morphogenesis protein
MSPLILALLQAGLIDLETAERLDRQLDPVRARAWAEQLLTEQYARGLSAQQSRLLELLQGNGYNVTTAQLGAFWQEEDRILFQSVGNGIADVLSERGIIAAVQAGNADPFNFVNRNLTRWLDHYASIETDALGSVGQLNLTSRQSVATAFRDWYNGDLGGRADGLPQLIRELEGTFGAARAERIAVTEVTRIFTEMTRAAEDANPDTTGFRWLTANDELVCEICGPMAGQIRSKNGQWPFGVSGPPAHPRCRCDITPVTALTGGS